MLNKVQIIGRVGKDPEIRYSTNGEAIANFTVATSERYKDKGTGEMIEKTEWHRVSAFRRLAEIVGEYVRKGSLIYIEGKLKTSSYEKAGVTHYATDIMASEMKMLTPKDGGQQHPEQPPQRPNQPTATANFDDDIPFY